MKNYEIYSLEWESERNLPELTDLEYDLIYQYSKVFEAGERKFPFITIYTDVAKGETKKIYLGA